MDMHVSTLGPADQLVGMTLSGGWLITEQLARDPGDSGTARAVCYRSKSNEGEWAFVKAYDFRNVETSGDTEALERMVAEYNNEKRIHQHCKDKRLSRVTNILDHGVQIVSGQPVHYIVCEYAESSLRRAHPPGEIGTPTESRLIALRKVASAIVQLHTVGVAHQDIKHSNVAYFNESVIKLTDLGSASCQHLPSPPHDGDALVGQPNLAPYELLYEKRPSSWRSRFACDTYLLGNMIFTSFVGISVTPVVLHGISSQLHPGIFTGDYQQVLPDLTTQHYELVPEFLSATTPSAILKDVNALVTRLCHPDPSRRGLGVASTAEGMQLDLHRCVSTLNTLAIRARLAGV